MLRYETHVLYSEFETNTYLVWDDESLEAILIDPSKPSEMLAERMTRDGLNVGSILLTHGHADHIGGVRFFREQTGARVGIHSEDAPMLGVPHLNLSSFMGRDISQPNSDFHLDDGDSFLLGKHRVRVIHTPGHTRGCVCFLVENLLFSGDTLFLESVGRTDLPGGSDEQLNRSVIEKLFTLPDKVKVLPGHGPATTILWERENNPEVER